MKKNLNFNLKAAILSAAVFFTVLFSAAAFTAAICFAPLPVHAESSGTTTLSATDVFNDISGNEWYASSVTYVYQHGLMTGTDPTTFSPVSYVSRAQFAVILYRMGGSPAYKNGIHFPDVPENTWYTDAVGWASSAGVITGYDNGFFDPCRAITREQLATMLCRYASYSGQDTSAAADLSSFADGKNVSSFALKAMRWCVASGIISGKTNTTLDPQGTCTRAECATMLMRFLSSYGDSDSETFCPDFCSDMLSCNQRGILTVSGWAYDQNDPESSLAVDIYINDARVLHTGTDLNRTDVNRAFDITGNHGYHVSFDLDDYVGNITVTVCCISPANGASAVIASRTITVTRYVGHRGYSAAAPENTVRSFTLAGQAGFWGCETDIWPTADGEFICLHDSNFQKMCGVAASPEAMTLSEIKQLTITSGNNLSSYAGDPAALTIPTLEEYLTVCKTYDMIPFIELKSGPHTGTALLTDTQIASIYAKVKSIMENRRVFIIAFDLDNLLSFRNYLDSVGETNIDLQFLTESPSAADFSVLSAHQIGIDAFYGSVSDSVIADARSNCLSIGAWTLDDATRSLSLLGKGCCSITTNTKLW